MICFEGYIWNHVCETRDVSLTFISSVILLYSLIHLVIVNRYWNICDWMYDQCGMRFIDINEFKDLMFTHLRVD